MKAVTPVGAAVVGAAEGAVAAADLFPAALGPDGLQVVARVVENFASEDGFRFEERIGVEAHENILLRSKGLQSVHVIGHDQLVPIRRGTHVPRGPGPAALVQDAGIRVKDRGIAVSAKGGEHLPFGLGGVSQQRQHLVAVASENHMVERQDFTVFHAKFRPLKVAADLGDLGPQNDAVRIRLCQRLDVAGRASSNGAPGLVGGEAQEPVVAEEGQQGEGRKGCHFIQRGGPDRSCHGVEIVLTKGHAESVLPEEFHQRNILIGAVIQELMPQLVEAQHFPPQSEKAGLHQVQAISEDAVEPPGTPGQSLRPTVKGEGHVALAALHFQFRQQTAEIRIVLPVVDDESHVHGQGATMGFHGSCEGMPAETVLLFQHRHAETPAQQVGRRQSGDASTDDRDFCNASLRQGVHSTAPSPLGRNRDRAGCP